MPLSRRRQYLTFWLVLVPSWVVAIVLGVAWVAIGAFWSIDSWQATHGGVQGSFTPLEERCGRDCTWNGEFRSDDGTYELADAQFSSGFGDPQPQATGETMSPVVVAPGGQDVYNPHDKTWAFAWIMSAMAPFITWTLIAAISRARADYLARGREQQREDQA